MSSALLQRSDGLLAGRRRRTGVWSMPESQPLSFALLCELIRDLDPCLGQLPSPPGECGRWVLASSRVQIDRRNEDPLIWQGMITADLSDAPSQDAKFMAVAIRDDFAQIIGASAELGAPCRQLNKELDRLRPGWVPPAEALFRPELILHHLDRRLAL